jgi:hypothetical protein
VVKSLCMLITLSLMISKASAATESQQRTCAPSGNLQFVCGAEHPEDLAHIPGTPWLIVSGFSEGAGLSLVDTRSGALKRWYAGHGEQIRPDMKRFRECGTPPDAASFNAHGINLKRAVGGKYTLYVVNHGGRESIEVFTVDPSTAEPSLVWNGCALLREGLAANSVAAFSDGTILATILTLPGTTITDFVRGYRTGEVVEWRPATQEFTPINGTELPGNNGLETSPDDTEFYVVAFGWHSVVVFSRTRPGSPSRQVVAPGFMPDNIHWDAGRLLAAGMQLDEPACGGTRKIVDGRADDMRCHRGYSVAELDPRTLEFKLVAYSEPNDVFNGVSAAVIIGRQLWLGSYQADRIAHRLLPGPVSLPEHP